MFGCLPIEFNYMVCTDANTSNLFGIRFTPGSSNTKGSWVQIISGTKLEKDCYLLHLYFLGNATASSVVNKMLLDIGIDENGGTNYVVKINNFPIQNVATTPTKSMFLLEIPIFIKAGSSVAIRKQCTTSPTVNGITVNSIFYGQPSRPEMTPRGLHFSIIGTITESTTSAVVIGDGFRDSTTGYKGTYQLIGTANRDYWAIIPSIVSNTNVVNNVNLHIDIGVGTDQTKITRIAHDLIVATSTSEEVLMPRVPILCRIKNGDKLYVRGKSTGTITSSSLEMAFLGIA